MVTEAVTLVVILERHMHAHRCVRVGSSTFSSRYEILSPDTNLVSLPALEAVICFQANRHDVVSLACQSCCSEAAPLAQVLIHYFDGVAVD